MHMIRALWIAGGVGLMVTRPLVSYSWNGLWGLSYQTYNQLSALPLLLLILGVLGLLRTRTIRFGTAARIGLSVTALGLLLSLGGIVLEFVIGGGLQNGPRYLAMWGWGIYLFGLLGQVVGLALYGAASWRSGAVAGPWRLVPLATALSVLLWPAGMEHWVGILLQVLFGFGWSVYGYALGGKDYRTAPSGGRTTTLANPAP